MVSSTIRFLLICSLAPSYLVAQDALEKLNGAMKAIEGGKLLQGISLLEPLAAKDAIAREMLGQIYPFVGECEKAKELRPAAAASYTTELPADYALSNAMDAILSEAKGRRMVIINEAHDAPEHRNFVGRLAVRLKEIGFTHYAFESLAEDSEQLRARGYPITGTGMYSQEPQFGELIRDAIKVGLIPIKYESEEMEQLDDPVDEINRREKAQCQNLVDRLLSKNPEARVLVHVGLDHVMEEPRKAGSKEILWLAARLKRVTGIDPLTIDQITSLHRGMASHHEPMVAQNSQQEFFVGGPYRGYVDMQVFHPQAAMVNGRPAWLAADSTRRMIDVPVEIRPKEGRLLVQARRTGESLDAIPSDQILIVSGLPCPMLSLRPGSYQIQSQNEIGTALRSQELVVE